jgi:hypothetical protein
MLLRSGSSWGGTATPGVPGCSSLRGLRQPGAGAAAAPLRGWPCATAYCWLLLAHMGTHACLPLTWSRQMHGTSIAGWAVPLLCLLTACGSHGFSFQRSPPSIFSVFTVPYNPILKFCLLAARAAGPRGLTVVSLCFETPSWNGAIPCAFNGAILCALCLAN